MASSVVLVRDGDGVDRLRDVGIERQPLHRDALRAQRRDARLQRAERQPDAVDEAAFQEQFVQMIGAAREMCDRMWAVTTANAGNPGAERFLELAREE